MASMFPMQDPDQFPGPQYPVDEMTALMRQFAPIEPPQQPQMGYMDRLALALSQMQAPQAGPYARSGDVFAANLVSGLARGFSAQRMASLSKRQKDLMDQYEAKKAQQLDERTLRMNAAEENYRAKRKQWEDYTKEFREARKQKTLAQIEAEAAAGARGRRSADPPPREKTLAEIEAEAAARARGALIGNPNANRPTIEESRAASFYNRAANAANNVMKPVKLNGKPSGTLEDYFANNSKAQFELVAPNLAKSPEAQAYAQAIKDFGLAFLRKESGAAIKDEEYADVAKTYFVVPGDKPETVKIKRRSRELVLQGLQREGARGGSVEEWGDLPDGSVGRIR